MLGPALFSAVFTGCALWFFFNEDGVFERLFAAVAAGVFCIVALAFGITWYDGGDIDQYGRETLPDEFVEELPFIAAYGGFLGFAIGAAWIGAMAVLKRTPGVVSEVSEVAKQRAVQQDELEEAVYSAISEELETGNIDRASWIKAYERANGDKQRAKAEYIRLRKKKLLNQ